MNKLGVWTKEHFVTVILAFTTGGFLLILAELLLARHWEGIQLVAPVSVGLGFVLALLALTGRRAVPIAGVFLLLSVTGLFGTFQHFEAHTDKPDGPPRSAAQAVAQTVSVTTPTADENAGPPEGEGRGGPPWLAPLSLSGLALLDSVATLAGSKNRQGTASSVTL